jgi:hypothetical protein
MIKYWIILVSYLEENARYYVTRQVDSYLFDCQQFITI